MSARPIDEVLQHLAQRFETTIKFDYTAPAEIFARSDDKIRKPKAALAAWPLPARWRSDGVGP